jgi:DNA modification methylase
MNVSSRLVDTQQVKGLTITYTASHLLKPYPHNARTHSKRQVRQIADCIQAFGFTNPVLIDAASTIIAGHGRVAAARLLGIDQVPTICLDAMSPEQIRAYVIADNKLAENAGWDESILKIELQHLMLDNTVDISLTGFEVPEIDLIVNGTVEAQDPADDLPREMANIVTRPGDLWLLGAHRILCGDAREDSSMATLMGEQRASVVFTDPPYNVVIDGHATGNGATHHSEFAMASGEMTPEQFTQFLKESCSQLAAWSMDGSIHFLCMDWRHVSELLSACRGVYDSLLNLCVWTKDNGGMGSFYRSQHELIFVFKKGKAAHRNNVQLGKFGRNRTNVWRYPGANTFSRNSEEGDLLSLHPTVKPIALVADALLDCSARGEIVLDSFLGSGSTLLAAERVGRTCYGLEIEPRYVDLAIRRWESQTGEKAVHAFSRLTFAEVMEQEVSHA